MSIHSKYRSFRVSLFYILSAMMKPLTKRLSGINWRFNRPYRCAGFRTSGLDGSLRPGMVILTHKDFELTNLVIPGYWTHAAMVTGKRHVIEAVGQGVIRRSLSDLISQADDFLILQPAFCGEKAMRKAASHIRKYLGLPYNFTFVPSDRSCYCSELIYRAYTEPLEMQSVAVPCFNRPTNGLPLIPHSLTTSAAFSRVEVGSMAG